MTRRSHHDPQPFGEQPTARLESGTREKLPASVQQAQRDHYEDNPASSSSSEVDELDEPLEDSQATLVQSDYSTHHLDSVDDLRQTVDSGKLGTVGNLVSIQQVPTSTVVEARAQTGPISTPLSGSPAARQRQQRHPTQPLPQLLVPHIGEAPPMVPTGANHPGFISRQQQVSPKKDRGQVWGLTLQCLSSFSFRDRFSTTLTSPNEYNSRQTLRSNARETFLLHVALPRSHQYIVKPRLYPGAKAHLIYRALRKALKQLPLLHPVLGPKRHKYSILPFQHETPDCPQGCKRRTLLTYPYSDNVLKVECQSYTKLTVHSGSLGTATTLY